VDAFHIGIAAAHQIEYLLTWNCKHIANAAMRGAIEAELHRVREDIGKAHDFDARRIAATIRQHEDQNAEDLVRQSPKRAPRQKKAS
jgi:hypothetical protein